MLSELLMKEILPMVKEPADVSCCRLPGGWPLAGCVRGCAGKRALRREVWSGNLTLTCTCADAIDGFHLTSRRPYLFPKTMK